MSREQAPTVVERPRSDRPEPAANEAAPDGGGKPPTASELGAAAARYRIGDEIARGGMGRVVAATDRLLGREVALKQMLDRDDEAHQRFAREMRITARLEHPAIIPLYDAGYDSDGNAYYVMRKVGGRPLRELIRDRHTTRERLALLPNLLAACDALAHAHRRGVIHRDLKPHNILVGEFGETLVIDWGLAKVVGEQEIAAAANAATTDTLATQLGTSMGTPGYMAPEQIDGQPCTAQSDVYALGACLYQVLTGRPPHDGDSVSDVIQSARRAPPPSAAQAAPGIAGELATVVDRALAYDRAVRYRDASALADDLRAFLTGQLVASHHYSLGARIVRFAKRHRVAVAVSAVALVVTATIAVISLRQVLAARDAARAGEQAANEARVREQVRADEAVVANARMVAESNPIAAVAALQSIAPESPTWRRARAVAALARSFGLPWAIAGPRATVNLVVTGDGRLGFAAGVDGDVWQLDFEARTSREIHRGPDKATLVALVDSDRKLVTTTATGLVIRDLASANEQPISWSGRLARLVAGGTVIAWIEAGATDRRVFVARLAERAPIAVPITQTTTEIALSPDGKRLATIGAHGCEVFDVTSDPPQLIYRHTGNSYDAAFSPDGNRLAIADHTAGFEIALDGSPIAERVVATRMTQATRYIGGVAAFLGNDGAPVFAGNSAPPTTTHFAIGMFSSAALTNGGVFAATPTNSLVLFNRGATIPIKVASEFSTMAGAADRVAVAVARHVLVYDLGAVLPRYIPITVGRLRLRGMVSDRYFLTTADDDWRIYDLVTGASSSMGLLGFSRKLIRNPSSGYLVVERTNGEIVLARPNQPPQPVGRLPENVLAAGPNRLAIIKDDAIETYNITTKQRTTVATLATPLDVAWATSRFIVGGTDRGDVFRWDITTGAAATARVAQPVVDVIPTSDGVVYVALAGSGSDRIVRWDGSAITTVAAPTASWSTLGFEGDEAELIATDKNGRIWRLDRGAHQPELFYPPWTTGGSHSPRARLAAVSDRSGMAWFYDMLADEKWPLRGARGSAAITPSGDRAVLAIDDGLVVYDVALPADPASYARWLGELTNLKAGRGEQLVFPATP